MSEHPDLAEEAFTQQIPGFNKKVKCLPDSGQREENPRGSTLVVTVLGMGRTTSTEGDTFRFEISFTPPVRVPSGEALKGLERTIAANIVKELPDFSRDYMKKQLTDDMASIEQLLKDAETKAGEAEAWVRREDPMPIEKTAEQFAEISRQLISTQLALAGMKAREQAIDDEIKKTEAKMNQPSDDRTLKGLEQLLKLRAQKLDREKQLAGQGVGLVPQEEVQKAEADVLAAQIDVDKTRSALKRAAGGERLDALNNELSRLAIDRAENEARLEFLDKKMQETSLQLRERRDIQQHVDEAKPKLEKLRAQIQSRTERLNELKDSAEHVQPLRVELPDSDAEEHRFGR